MPDPIVYAFIDSQNINLGTSRVDKWDPTYVPWKLDFAKFRVFLRDRYGVSKAYLFIGYIPGNEKLYERLQNDGYICIFKPTVNYVQDGKPSTKGNVDSEITLYASAKLFDDYDKAVIASADGDFHCLYEYLQEKGKLGNIIVPRRYSSLLRKFSGYLGYLEHNRNKLRI